MKNTVFKNHLPFFIYRYFGKLTIVTKGFIVSLYKLNATCVKNTIGPKTIRVAHAQIACLTEILEFITTEIHPKTIGKTSVARNSILLSKSLFALSI